MKNVTLIGRYRVYKHKRHWIVTVQHAHGDGCISTHGSYATACAAARRYDQGDRARSREASRLLLGLLEKKYG